MDPLEMLRRLGIEYTPPAFPDGPIVTVPMPQRPVAVEADPRAMVLPEGPQTLPPGPAPSIVLPPPPAFPPGVSPLAPGMSPSQPTVTMPMPPPGVPTMPAGLAPNGPLESSSPFDTLQQILEPSTWPLPAEPSRQGGYGPAATSGPVVGGQGQTGRPSGSPPASSPAGPGAAPSSPPQVATAPEPAGTQGASSGTSALSDPNSRARTYQLLSIMGAILAQPIPPGGNPMGQIGKALGMGTLYQDAMARADQERADKRIEQAQVDRRLGVQERSVGIDARRADTGQFNAETDRAGTIARIRNLDAQLPGILAGAKLTEAQAELARIHAIAAPAQQALALQEFQRKLELTGAQVDKMRSEVDTPAARRSAKLTELLQKGGALGDPSLGTSFDVDKAITITGINGPALGLQPMSKEQSARGQAAYEKLIKEGKSPAEADQILYTYSVQSGVQPRRWSPSAAKR